MKRERYNNILEKIVLGSKNKEISDEYGVSPSYISQIRKRIESLRYKPIIDANTLVCTYCKDKGSLVIHHSHDTNEQIAIVCRGCNVAMKNNDTIPHAEKNLGSIISFRMNEKIKHVLDQMPQNMTQSKWIRKLISKGFNSHSETSTKKGDGRDWKGAFTTMYSFFKDIMMNANIVLPEESAQQKWSELWMKYGDMHMEITELARLVTNT